MSGSQARRDEDGPKRGAVFLLRADLLPSPIRDLLQTAARAVFVARRGTLSDQLARLREPEPMPRRQPQSTVGEATDAAARTTPPLEFFNGLGGFAAEAREYVVVLDEDQRTPAPWINVIANSQFGFQVSADGAGSTWSLNAQQNQITPWSNDPVSDPPSEAIYIRDEDSGALWSATPLPIPEPSCHYVVRHGFGYSRFEHTLHGMALSLLQFVPLEHPVKISRLKIANRSGQTRQLSVTHYLDWVLGNQRSKTAPFVVTEIEPKTSALFARNAWGADFQSRVAFMDMAGRQETCTADRSEFIGRHGSMAEPAALLAKHPLSNRVGGGLDPCGAMQTRFVLRPGEETELTFLLGEEASSDAAIALIERYRTTDLDVVLKEVSDYWSETLGATQVKTPDRSMDILLNGWLLYQTLSSRVWARTAFYQSSGAYGFRDQLQDVMALAVSKPGIAREHILRAAGRQFEEGDVQHWWLPTSGQGVKTRVSDDRIWLAYVVAHYLEVTEDFAVLEEEVPFLAGGPLPADSQESFAAPESLTKGSLYEHCVRALDSSLAIGSHGLPLFGTGDWNDGMNRVGVAGRGESVWLGWFLYATLLRFAPIADRRQESTAAAVWRKHAHALQQAIEREAWDGDWYRRGYFDDGTPLGSVTSDECRIDSIAQSWAVISGAGDTERSVKAMSAVNAQLVSRSDGLVQLFTPAFDRTPHDPGYIKAYPPGLRENGGQYTHAAMWTTLAFALQGDGDRAGELFSIINPINHSSTRAGIHRYKVEPYVVCADVYSAAQHVGRGGWTWYTGSAAWMYRTAMEGMLGVNMRGSTLMLNPCIPRAWKSFEITRVYGSSRYHILFENPQGVCRGIVHASLDGRELPCRGCEMPLVDDGRDHERVGSSWADQRGGRPRPFLPSRNAPRDLARNIRATAPAGSMRSNRSANPGRAMKRPPASAPSTPRPRPPMSICMVRLRGKASPSGSPVWVPSWASRRGGSSNLRSSSRESASLARISASAGSSRSVISILIRGQYALEQHPVLLPFLPHRSKKLRSRTSGPGSVDGRKDGSQHESAPHPRDGAHSIGCIPGVGHHCEAAHQQREYRTNADDRVRQKLARNLPLGSGQIQTREVRISDQMAQQRGRRLRQ